MNFKKIILSILSLGVFSSANNVHCMGYSKKKSIVTATIGIGVSAYLLYKLIAKSKKTHTIPTIPSNYLSHTTKTEDFLNEHLEHSSLHPNILNSQGLTEGIRNNILSLLTEYRCMQKINTTERHRSPHLLCQLNNGNLVLSHNETANHNTIKIWDIYTGKCLKNLRGHKNRIIDFCILSNGDLASCAEDCTIKIWNTNNGICLRTLRDNDHEFKNICALPNGNIATDSFDNKIRIWDCNAGKCLRVLEGHAGWIYSLCSLADGNLASSSGDETIKIWNINTGECLKTLEGHYGSIYSLCILNNGSLVSASSDKTIKIWDTKTGECIRALTGHKNPVTALCVLQNGNLVSSSFDYTINISTIKIWNVTTGECLQTLFDADRFLLFCALSNGMFASSSLNGEIKIWGNKFDIKV